MVPYLSLSMQKYVIDLFIEKSARSRKISLMGFQTPNEPSKVVLSTQAQANEARKKVCKTFGWDPLYTTSRNTIHRTL